MIEIVKFITITTVSVCVVNLIKKLDEDFNNMSYIRTNNGQYYMWFI